MHLHSLGFTWIQMDLLGFTWIHWIHLDSPGFTWTHLDSLGSTRIHLDYLGFTWTHLDSLGLTWSHLNSPGLTRTTENSNEIPSREKREKGKGTGQLNFPQFPPHYQTMRACVRTKRNDFQVALPPTFDSIKNNLEI